MPLLVSLLLAWWATSGIEARTEDLSGLAWWGLFLGLALVMRALVWLAGLGLPILVADLLDRADAAANTLALGRMRGYLALSQLCSWIARLISHGRWARTIVHVRRAGLLERTGHWQGMLRSAGAIARASDTVSGRLSGYALMLRALAILDQPEAFALTFGAAEGVLADKLPANLGGDLTLFRPLARPNASRGVLAMRAGDLADAAGWFERAATLDPEDIEPRLALLDIAGWEGREPDGVRLADAIRPLASHPTSREQELVGRMREAVHRHLGAPGEAHTMRAAHEAIETAVQRGTENSRWQAAWGEIRFWALMRRPDRIQQLLDEQGSIAERHPTGQAQARIARMLVAALRREGNSMEAPYAELLHLLKTQLVPAALRLEIPLWRAMALIFRGQFEAAVQKFDEMMAADAIATPPFYRILANAYGAWCLERLGEGSKAGPRREAARALAPAGSRIAALGLTKKDRLLSREKGAAPIPDDATEPAGAASGPPA